MERTPFPDPEQHRLASVLVLNTMMWDRAVASWMRERAWFTAASGQPELPFEPSLSGFAYVVWDYDDLHQEAQAADERALGISLHAHAKAVEWRQWSQQAAAAIRQGNVPPREPAPRDLSVPDHIRRHNQGLASMSTMSSGGSLAGIIAPEPFPISQAQAWEMCRQYRDAVNAETRELRLEQRRELAAQLAYDAALDRQRSADPVWHEHAPTEQSINFSGPAR